MTMIAADELYDAIAAGVGASQTQSAHGSLGTAINHAYLVHGRHQAAD